MASGKVDSLADAQWDDARAVRGEYLAASVCTDPADRPAAESAISRMYELAGHEVPQFIWCQSPAAVRLVIRMLSPRAGGPLAGALGRPLDADIETSLVREVEESLRRSLKGVLGRELRRDLRFRLGGRSLIARQVFATSADNVMWRPLQSLFASPLGESVKESLQAMLWPPDPDPRWNPPQEREPRSESRWSRNGGQFESWMTEFDVARRLGLVTFGREDNERLDLWCTLARSCGWWLAYQHVCVVAERPAVVCAEAPGAWSRLRLHCPDGPALAFRDGWSVHAWHGTAVPATLIEGGWDFAAIMAERNGEVRRCAIEKLGWSEFERHLLPVASAPDPGNPGQVLKLCGLPEAIRDTYSGPLLLLLCSNGTPEADGTRRRFALQVPPHHTDPVAAAAELYGWTRDEYAALARRA
jgi:hypothetical protein